VATVVFADLVGSTGIFERLGDETAGHFVTQLTTALSKTFEQHSGRVVKLLGDGLFVVFPDEGDAIEACLAIQKRLQERPVHPGGTLGPVQMQMGVDDLAGAAQILTTQRVAAALSPGQREQLRSLGPMYLRGKSDVTQVYRVDWQVDRDNDETVMGASLLKAPGRGGFLELAAAGQTVRLEPRGDKLTLGRAVTSSLSINDSRVSRLHASVEWRGGQFVLSDASSFGTWVYMGNQTEPVVLRRTECYLVGHGQITLGCDRHADNAPLVLFSVTG
jgi:adenylate cyclase